MIARLFLVLLVLAQTLPVTVLALGHCAVCEHSAKAAAAGAHCPRRTAVSERHECHGPASRAADRIRASGCTCGERAAAALAKPDPAAPPAAAAGSPAPAARAWRAATPAAPADVAVRPPDPPPRSPLLLDPAPLRLV